MRICLITGIFPPDIGGPATYVSRLADALQAQGHHIQVVTQGTAREDDPPYVTRVSCDYPLLFRLLVIFLTVIRYGWRCQVWYINGLELPAVLAGKLLRKRMIMKIVGDYAWERAVNFGRTTDLIDEFQQKTQCWKVGLHKILRSWYSRQVAHIITPSQYLKRLVCGWGVPEHRIQVVYNAVEPWSDELISKSDIRKRFGFLHHEQLLVTVGRLVPWKGIDRIIEALPSLAPSVKLLVIGSGPQKQTLANIAARLNVSDRVRFLGKLSRNETFRYMRAADVFVLNTAYEGFSHVLLEAMMVGTPVLTTTVGGNPELVTHRENGLLLSSDDAESVAGQLKTLLEDPELQDRLKTSGRKAAQQYSWERLLQQTLGILMASDV